MPHVIRKMWAWTIVVQILLMVGQGSASARNFVAAGSGSAFDYLLTASREFANKGSDLPTQFKFHPLDASAAINEVQQGKADFAIMMEFLNAGKSVAATTKPDEKNCKVLEIGRCAVALYASPRLGLGSVSAEVAENLLSGNGSGAVPATALRFYSKYPNVGSSWLIHRYGLNTKIGANEACEMDGMVPSQVAQSLNAVGVQLVAYWDGDLKSRDLMPTRIMSNGEAMLPTKENVATGRYPMIAVVSIAYNPSLNDAGSQFVGLLLAAKSRETFRNRLMVVSEREEVVQAERIAAMKAGKGAAILVSGQSHLKNFTQDLNLSYVKAKAVVQIPYQPFDSDMTAVGGFLQGNGSTVRELVFLSSRADEQSLKAYSKQWTDLKPQEYFTAARGVGIVAHGSNKLSSVTLDQIKGLLSGQLDDWKALGGTPGKTFLYTLPNPTEASKYVVKELLGDAGKMRTDNKQRKDTADVISAVSLDPQGIGIVDLSAMPDLGADLKGVKILGIGPAMKPVSPSIEAIRTGAYPLAQPLYLYVHPKASETAKDFAAFIASGECDETFRKNGLIPLSEKAVKASVLKPAATNPANPAKTGNQEKAGASK